MAEIRAVDRVALSVTLTLDESEARALDALACYGTEAFLKVFYAHLGKHYLKPHESAFRRLMDTWRGSLPGILARTDEARGILARARKEEAARG